MQGSGHPSAHHAALAAVNMVKPPRGGFDTGLSSRLLPMEIPETQQPEAQINSSQILCTTAMSIAQTPASMRVAPTRVVSDSSLLPQRDPARQQSEYNAALEMLPSMPANPKAIISRAQDDSTRHEGFAELFQRASIEEQPRKQARRDKELEEHEAENDNLAGVQPGAFGLARQEELHRKVAEPKEEIHADLCNSHIGAPGPSHLPIAGPSRKGKEVVRSNNVQWPARSDSTPQPAMPSRAQPLNVLHNEHDRPPSALCTPAAQTLHSFNRLVTPVPQDQAGDSDDSSPHFSGLEEWGSYSNEGSEGPADGIAAPGQVHGDGGRYPEPNNASLDAVQLPSDDNGWEDGDLDGPDGEAPATESFADPLAPLPTQRNPEKQLKAAHLLLQDLNTHTLVCPRSVHNQMHAKHMLFNDDNHHRIVETYNAPDPTDLRGHTHGLKTNTFPNINGPKPTSHEAQSMRQEMEGLRLDENGNAGPLCKNVCLHMEPPDMDDPQSSWDVDSMIMFPSSLAFLKKPLQVYSGKSVTKNLRTNIHLMKQCQVRNRDDSITTKSLQLKDIPHAYFGSVVADVPCDVLVFFPQMVANHGQKFKYLTDQQWNTFCEHIVYPAMDGMNAVARQKVPANNGAALAAASAMNGAEWGDEGADIHDIALRRARGAGHYTVRAEDLVHMDERMKSILSEADARTLLEYRDFFFMCSNKDMKASHGSMLGLVSAYDTFTTKFLATYDMDHCTPDQLYLDIAREVVPQPAPAMDRHRRPGFGKVYQWKTCCLDHKYKAFKEELFSNLQGQRTLFNEGFLRDTGTMTLDPPPRVAIETGLVYSQWYNSNKNITDAMKNKPFMQPHLPELCTDPAVFEAQARSANVNNAKKARQDQMRQWLNGKYRVKAHYSASKHVSYGIRTEHRVSWDLLAVVVNLARRPAAQAAGAPRAANHSARGNDVLEASWAADALDAAEADASGRTGADAGAQLVPLSYVWCIAGNVYSDFMLGNYDKFVRIWEVGYHSQSLRIRMPVSNVEYCLMKLLRNFHNSNIQRMSILKYGDVPELEDMNEAQRAEHNNQPKYGLGVLDNMNQYGYGWIMERIDFERFVWLDKVAAHMPRICSDWVRWVQQSRMKISETHGQLEILESLMVQYWERHAARQKLMLMMAHILCSQFRYDVKKMLRNELRGRAADIDNDHGLYFYWDGLKEHTTDPTLVWNNRLDIKTPGVMFTHLWGDKIEDTETGHKYDRARFNSLPFRTAFRTVISMLGGKDVNEFVVIFRNTFFEQHSVLPYPNGGTLLSLSKAVKIKPKGANAGNWVPTPAQRRWWAVKQDKKGNWIWAKNQPEPNRPPPFMSEARRTAEQIQIYLRGLRDY